MSTATTTVAVRREPELLGQTVVVIGGSAGIGLETARRAHAEGARLVLTGRNAERLQLAAGELEALSIAAFDATDPAPLARFFGDLPATIDHVMVTAGQPHYGRLLDMDFEQARRALDMHLLLMLQVTRKAAHKVRPGGPPCCSWAAPAAAAQASEWGLCRQSQLRSPPSPPASRSNSRPSESTSSPPASSTRRCRHRSSAMSSTTAAISFAPRFLSGASSHRPTSPRLLYTS